MSGFTATTTLTCDRSDRGCDGELHLFANREVTLGGEITSHARHTLSTPSHCQTADVLSPGHEARMSSSSSLLLCRQLARTDHHAMRERSCGLHLSQRHASLERSRRATGTAQNGNAKWRLTCITKDCAAKRREVTTNDTTMQRNYTKHGKFLRGVVPHRSLLHNEWCNDFFSLGALEYGPVFRATIKPVRKTFFCSSPRFRNLALRCHTPLRDAIEARRTKGLLATQSLSTTGPSGRLEVLFAGFNLFAFCSSSPNLADRWVK